MPNSIGKNRILPGLQILSAQWMASAAWKFKGKSFTKEPETEPEPELSQWCEPGSQMD